ncbi:MAG: RICIN domain-containing protein [Chitinophagaceae bacterium]|nr:RICIN domain-containing protein [Oligoflexus sp.]
MTRLIRSLRLHTLSNPTLILLFFIAFALWPHQAHAQFTTQPIIIMGKGSGKCINIRGAFNSDNTAVIQYTCEGASNSHFTLDPVGDGFMIRAAHSDKCLNVSGANAKRGAKVIQWPCNGKTNEIWALEKRGDFYRLRAKHSGLCLNVPGDKHDNNRQFIQWDCSDDENELFSFGSGFVPADQGIRLVSHQSQKCLAVADSSTSPGTRGIQLTCKHPDAIDSASQVFKIVRSIDDTYALIASHSSQCLTVEKSSSVLNAKIIQARCDGNSGQQWKILRLTDGFQLANKKSTLCLDSDGSPDAEGVGLVQRPCVKEARQSFAILYRNRGTWSPLIGVPLVPVAAATLPNSKIMLWASYDSSSFGGDHGSTETATFDPATNSTLRYKVANTGHDMFCPGSTMLADGRLLVNGGVSASKTTVYNYSDNSWSKSGEMNSARGYNATTTLDDGKAFTMGGSWSGHAGGKDGEVWDPATNTWTKLTGIPADRIVGLDPQGVYRGDNHAWLFGVGAGRVFHAGPSPQMNWFGTKESGDFTTAGNRLDDGYSINGNAAMFDIGRILKVGGAAAYQHQNAKATAYIIDINQGLDVQSISPMAFARAFSNSVILPDGRVMILGGQSYPVPFSDATAVLTPELFDPKSNTFSLLTPMDVPRTYHSIALLLPDARVIVAGGGLCGKDCENNHPNVQIYSPDYLTQPNGQAAARPTINDAPAEITYNTDISVDTDRAVTAFSLVRLSSTTHTVNNDQRRIPLLISTQKGTSYNLRSPANSGVAIPGFYMLFALTGDGVPSVAKIVKVK